MPPRPGQLDEISEAIGRLSGQIDALDRYTHEREHGINNLAQKVEALGTRITRDIAAVEGRMEGRLKAMDDRILDLEIIRQQEAGARSFALGAVRHGPAIITILTGLIIVIVILIANGRL